MEKEQNTKMHTVYGQLDIKTLWFQQLYISLTWYDNVVTMVAQQMPGRNWAQSQPPGELISQDAEALLLDNSAYSFLRNCFQQKNLTPHIVLKCSSSECQSDMHENTLALGELVGSAKDSSVTLFQLTSSVCLCTLSALALASARRSPSLGVFLMTLF